MTGWLSLTDEQRRTTLQQAFLQSNIEVQAIEKDWWVTLCLKALYSTPYAVYCIFKGGTSLSKGRKLIQRFSEDIDIALDPKAFGMEYQQDPSGSYVKRLKRKGCAFTSTLMKESLEEAFIQLGIPVGTVSIEAKPVPPERPDTDPQTLYIRYTSLFDPHPYLAAEVKMEFGVRSLKEPYETVMIQSILNEVFPNPIYSDDPFPVIAVDPRKTLLEKTFLLHEKFMLPHEKVLQDERQSRHLYDIVQLMGTSSGEEALKDIEFYMILLQHREKYVGLGKIDYSGLHWSTLNFVPVIELLEHFKNDYEKMRVMIYGEYPGFDDILQRLKFFNGRFRLIGTGLTLEEVIAKALQENESEATNKDIRIVKLPVQLVNTSGVAFHFIVTMHRYRELVFENIEVANNQPN